MIERRETSQKPEKIPDRELGNLVAATANHEAKCLMLIAMKPGEVYPSPDIYREFISLQGKNPGWRIAHLVPFQYCRDSLHPIGLVAWEVRKSDNVLGYAITDYGQDIGIPLAGLLLDFSIRHPEFSLYDFFGSTYMGGADEEVSKRAPVTRMQILWELATTDKEEGKLRVVDLVKALGRKQDLGNMGTHLKQMSERGVISYDSKETINKPITLYHLSDKQPDSLTTLNERHPVMTKRVHEAMLSEPEKLWTREEIVNAIIDKYPELYFSRKSIYDHTVSVLGALRDAKLVHYEKFHHDLQSEAYLTPEQREVVVELLEILDSVQNKNPEVLRKGKELAGFFLTHPAEVASLMQKAKEHSPHASADKTENINYVLQALTEQPYISAKDIQKILKEKHERILTVDSIRSYLKTLMKDKTRDDPLEFEEIKGVYYWYLRSTKREKKLSEGESTRRIDQVDFPETEHERFIAAQNTFINSYIAKTYLLLPLNGEINSKLELYRRSKAFTKESDVDNGAFKSFIYNADRALYPAGLIAKEFMISPIGHEKHSGYGLTEAGRLYGVPAAVLAVYFENTHGYSLKSAIGHARSVDSPGLYDRAKILLNLAQKEEGSDLSEILNDVGGYKKLIEAYLKTLKDGEAILQSQFDEKITLSEKGKTVVKEYLEPLLKLLRGDEETRAHIMEQLLPEVMEEINSKKSQ